MRKIFWILFVLSILVEFVSYAQPGDPNSGGKPGEQIPIDGGLLYLLAAGISFGIYKLRGKKKQ